MGLKQIVAENKRQTLKLVETTPDAKAELNYASYGERALAFLFDLLVVSFFSSLIVTSSLLYYSYLQIRYPLPPLAIKAQTDLQIYRVLVDIIIYTSYFTLFYWYNNGRSLGKMLMRLKIQTDQPISFKYALLRTLCYYPSYFLFGLGFAFPLWRADRRTLHDLIMNSDVVRSGEHDNARGSAKL